MDANTFVIAILEFEDLRIKDLPKFMVNPRRLLPWQGINIQSDLKGVLKGWKNLLHTSDNEMRFLQSKVNIYYWGSYYVG